MQGPNVPQETVETAQMLAQLFLAHEQRIVEENTTGAGWEIWLQVEFILWTRETSKQFDWSAARELSYSGSSEKLDFGLRRKSKYYGIELKAETANRWPGKVTSSALWTGMQTDVEKLKNFFLKSGKSTDYGGGFAIGVVFHPQIKALGLGELNGTNPAKVGLNAQQVLYIEGTQIGVIIAIQD